MDINLFGIISLFVVIFGLWLFILIATNYYEKMNPHTKKKRYDERQLIVQGKAFKYAFFSLLGYQAIWYFTSIFEIVWHDVTFGILFGITLSGTTFFAICIFNDAFIRIGETMTGVLFSINIIGFSQILLAVSHITNGDIIHNGIISGINSANLMICAVVFSIDLFCFIRKRMDKKQNTITDL